MINKINTFTEIFDIVKMDNWRDILSKAPYHLTIKEKGDYVLFKYSTIDGSNFTHMATRQARGIIFRKPDMTPVCVPFYKFGNIGEYYTDKIDWKSHVIMNKEDGSIIKLWFDEDEWRVSTDSSIDARDSNVNETSDIFNRYNSYYELFQEAAINSNLDYSRLNKDNTYMFELTSPYNKIVTKYQETKLFHLGTRNNITQLELEEDIGVAKPETFSIKGPFKVLRLRLRANKFRDGREGFVVKDNLYNRIKIKSKHYVKFHKVRNNGMLNFKSRLDIIMSDDYDEYIIYFPEDKKNMEEIIYKIALFGEDLQQAKDDIKSKTFLNKRDLSIYVMRNYKGTGLEDFAFRLYDTNFTITPNEYIKSLTVNALERTIKNKYMLR